MNKTSWLPAVLLVLGGCTDASGGEGQAMTAAAGSSSAGGMMAVAGLSGVAGRALGGETSGSATGGSGSAIAGTSGLANGGGAGASDPNADPGDDPKNFPGHGPGTIFDAEILPIAGEKFAKASYRIYVPDGVPAIRGIIIRQHGCGRNGIEMAHDLQWQVLANKWFFALLGTHYDDAGNCGNWANLNSGSVQALERALSQFASDAKRPELATVPWAIWGHSGGGNWAYAVVAKYPERVIAGIPRSGSNGALPAPARLVPQLFSAGQKEQGNATFGGAYDETVKAFQRERPLGALVGLSLDPEATHDIRQGRLLAIPYLDACIRTRLPSIAGGALRTVAEESGWLGDPSSFATAAFGDYAGDKTAAAWLPDQTVARKWAEFSKTGQVVDTTPPVAPRSLMAVREGAAVRLSWAADADLDSGIKRFVVYKDGAQLGEVGNPFQQGNFGDEPEPATPSMTYVDATAQGSPVYEVSTVNFFDLESVRSPKASP